MSSIGTKIDELYLIRERKRAMEKELAELSKTYAEIEAELLEHMLREDTEAGKGKHASASIIYNVRPSVEDWDKFYAYIHRHKLYHLLERRPSVSGCKELFETKGKIPGVVPFTQRKLNLRSI